MLRSAMPHKDTKNSGKNKISNITIQRIRDLSATTRDIMVTVFLVSALIFLLLNFGYINSTKNTTTIYPYYITSNIENISCKYVDGSINCNDNFYLPSPGQLTISAPYKIINYSTSGNSVYIDSLYNDTPNILTYQNTTFFVTEAGVYNLVFRLIHLNVCTEYISTLKLYYSPKNYVSLNTYQPINFNLDLLLAC
jgi:hypothetical protein